MVFCFLDLKYPRGTIWHTPTEDLPKRKNALQEIGETTGNTQKHHGICHGVYQKLPPQYEGIKRMSNNSAELLMDPRHVSFRFSPTLFRVEKVATADSRADLMGSNTGDPCDPSPGGVSSKQPGSVGAE